MAYWHEQQEWVGEYILLSADGTIRAHIRLTNQTVEPRRCEIYLMEWRGIGPFAHPDQTPDAWMELWPRQPLVFTERTQAETAARDLLALRETGSTPPNTFEEQQHCPIQRESIQILSHPGMRIQAEISHRSDGLFEVRYYEFAHIWEAGPATPAEHRTDEWDSIRVRQELITLADSLESARDTARTEMEGLADEANSDVIASQLFR